MPKSASSLEDECKTILHFSSHPGLQSHPYYHQSCRVNLPAISLSFSAGCMSFHVQSDPIRLCLQTAVRPIDWHLMDEMRGIDQAWYWQGLFLWKSGGKGGFGGFLPNISIDLMVIGRIDARMLGQFKGFTGKPQGNHRCCALASPHAQSKDSV